MAKTSLDEEIAKMTVPEICELMNRLTEELETRYMILQEDD